MARPVKGHFRLKMKGGSGAWAKLPFVLATIFILLTLGRIPGVFANPWQLGWGTDDSTGYQGVGSNQMVVGSISYTGGFWDLVGFNEAYNNDWMNIATGDSNGGNKIYVAMEVLPAAGGSYQSTLCTGLSTGVYNTDKIVWNSLSEWWAFTTTACSSGYEYSEFVQTDSIKNGAKDFLESYDNSTSDFASMNAYTKCEYCMLYWTGTQWDTPVDVSSYYTAGGTYPYPPSNLGVDYGCTGTNEPWNIIGSNYGGLWSYGNYPSPVCS